MSQPNRYDIGDPISVYTATPFKDENGVPVDPNIVRCRVKTPDGTVTTYVYGVDSEVTKVDTGDYALNLNLDAHGQWFYRWDSEDAAGNYMGADEETFFVKRSNIV